MTDTNNTNATLIETFYTAFQQKDYTGMNACYAENIVFEDPVFGKLAGNEAKAMWHMLCERGKDLQITFEDVQASEYIGAAHWQADYTFSTGRKVHNVIYADFEFADGKITTHKDYFDLWKWTRMALGPSGLFLGWTPMMQGKVQASARKGLDAFMAAHPEYNE